jgi:hypothetical protein
LDCTHDLWQDAQVGVAARSIPQETVDEILALHRSGAQLNAIAARLKGKVSRSTIATVLAKARKGGQKAAKKTKAPSSPPSPPSPPKSATCQAEASAELPGTPAVPADPRLAVVGLLDDAYARLLRLLEALDGRLADEVAKPSPDWTFIAKARAEIRHLREDAVRFKPTEAASPEADPHNVEAARVLVADLRARVEAASRARAA